MRHQPFLLPAPSGLVPGWGEKREAGVQRPTVVEDLDELEDRLAGPGPGRPEASVHQLLLQGSRRTIPQRRCPSTDPRRPGSGASPGAPAAPGTPGRCAAIPCRSGRSAQLPAGAARPPCEATHRQARSHIPKSPKHLCAMHEGSPPGTSGESASPLPIGPSQAVKAGNLLLNSEVRIGSCQGAPSP